MNTQTKAFKQLAHLINPDKIGQPLTMPKQLENAQALKPVAVVAMIGEPMATSLSIQASKVLDPKKVSFEPGVCAKKGCRSKTTVHTADHFSFCAEHSAVALSATKKQYDSVIAEVPDSSKKTAAEIGSLCACLSSEMLHDILYLHIAPAAAAKMDLASSKSDKKFYSDVLQAVSNYKAQFNPWQEIVLELCKTLTVALLFFAVGLVVSGSALVGLAVAIPAALAAAGVKYDMVELRDAGMGGLLGAGVGGAGWIILFQSGSAVVCPPVGVCMLAGGLIGSGVAYFNAQ